MKILIDSSVWVDYFRSGIKSKIVDFLIDENLIVINEIILSELVPYLLLKKQNKVVKLLKNIELIALNINWSEIIQIQEKCLKKGINGIGIPDLIIAQNAIQNSVPIYTFDKHFTEISKVTKLKLKE